MCDITDKEFERIYLPVCINYDNYLKEFILPDVVAFYISHSFYKKALSKVPLYNHINSAIDIFNVRCHIDKLIPSIKKILRIKYNLRIVNNNPMILKKKTLLEQIDRVFKLQLISLGVTLLSSQH